MSQVRSVSMIIADNNEFYRRVLGDFFREEGFEVRVASDGIEALEMIKQRRPDLLLLDLIMPRLDGARLSAFLKGQEAFRDIPIIILSGILADEIDGVEEIRADAYIAKMPLEQIQDTLKDVARKLVDGLRDVRPILSGFEKMYRREVVLELLEERRSAQVTLDSLSEGIVEVSQDRRVLVANRAMERITGQPASAMIALPLDELFPESRPVLKGLFEDVGRGQHVAAGVIRQGGRELQIKLHRLEPDAPHPTEGSDADDAACASLGPGSGVRQAVRRAARTTSKVRLDAAAQCIGYTLLVEDITERVKAEREREQLRSRLAQSEKMSAIGLFVAGAAHELNNPLTSVLGYAQLLLQGEKGHEVRKELEKIAAGASRCKKILENLMAFARSNRPAKVAVDFNALLMESLGGYGDRLRDAGIELSLELATDLPATLADPLQILQAFNSIVDNAHKAMTGFPGRRLLSVASKVSGSRIVIEIGDTGPGIPHESLGKIFEPFFTTRQVGQGAGLGLSVAYGMVTAHAGRVGVRNQANGGAIVTLEFPIIARDETAPAAAAPRAGEVSRAAPAERRILIVDDEAIVQELLVDILERDALRIDTASNGLEGLRRIGEKDYDLIILDLRMPDMTGQQMYEELARSRPEMLGRLLFITADTVTPEVDHFLKSVGSPCLTKPFAVDMVMQRVESILSHARV